MLEFFVAFFTTYNVRKVMDGNKESILKRSDAQIGQRETVYNIQISLLQI